MARWKAIGHAVIVAFTCYFNCLPQAALAASEAQLKFLPVLAASSTSKEDRFRSPREFNGLLVNKSRPLNATIDVAMRKQIIGPVEHYTGLTEAAATHYRQQSQQEVVRRQESFNFGDGHSRNYRGGRGYNSGYSVQGSPEHLGPPHGEHYSSRHHSEQRFGGQDGGYPSTRLHQVPVRENRVEVRIHDYRRDQGITNDAVGIWQQRQRRHRGAQNPSDRDEGRQSRPGQGFSGQNDLLPSQNRLFDSGVTGGSFDNGPDGDSSCGPRSLCVESNGLFPVDGNCCGFVSCANCRPYTQRCAAGTVFDLDLWACNHVRDTERCAGNNRECAHTEVNLRGDYGDSTEEGQGGHGRQSSSRGYHDSDDSLYHGSFHNGQPYQMRHHSPQYNSGDYGGGSPSHRGPGWEFAAASEPKVSSKSGKVLRVSKEVIATLKKKKAVA
ncbi:uncharacterized protein LOC111246374 isoform X1 [Varroa destructor]|uniref:Chitin-binding type-2 domain-containing protein n=1 Tax=Varroa destructor TaxID=109461 RepID=A0A7M7JV43_VARDE|nr:uncharacterized protein LOC111246374 isoform X1 [Varroa destructor]